jgi:hypothetical protein
MHTYLVSNRSELKEGDTPPIALKYGPPTLSSKALFGKEIH